MKWSEPIISEWRGTFGAAQREVIVRIGIPRPEPRPYEWVCYFQIVGLSGNKVQRAYGIDGLQAITIAADAIRKRLNKLRDAQVGGVSYEFCFPKLMPTSYGLEFHRELVRLIDDKVAVVEKALTKARLARTGRRKA